MSRHPEFKWNQEPRISLSVQPPNQSNYDLLRFVDPHFVDPQTEGHSLHKRRFLSIAHCLLSSSRNMTRTRRLSDWRHESGASSSSPRWNSTVSYSWRHRTSWTVWWSRSPGHDWRGKCWECKTSIRLRIKRLLWKMELRLSSDRCAIRVSWNYFGFLHSINDSNPPLVIPRNHLLYRVPLPIVYFDE